MAWITSPRPRVTVIDTLGEHLSNRLRLRPTPKRAVATYHQHHCAGCSDRVKLNFARQFDEDIAVISTIPLHGDSLFRCSKGIFCRLGDWRYAEPGVILHIICHIHHLFYHSIFPSFGT